MRAREESGTWDWWQTQLEWSDEVRKDQLDDWRQNIAAYRDRLKTTRTEDVRLNIEYEKTEQKRHQLFFRVPELRLKPHPRTIRERGLSNEDDLRRAVTVFREVLQFHAGPKGLRTKKLIDKLLFDVLCPAGIAACKVGYERYESGTVQLPTGRMMPGPSTGQPGAILDLNMPLMVPEMERVPNVVADRYFASRISPGDLLLPADFVGNDYAREADWLGYDFWIPEHDAKRRKWHLPAEYRPTADADEDATRLVSLERSGGRKGHLRCREIWCYAQRIYAGVAHPERIRRLVFVKGVKEPIVDQDAKDQEFDDRGRLIRGIRTLPVKVLTLRYVSDWLYPPSDCSISRRVADELSEARAQMVLHRKKAIPMRQININRVVDERVRDLIIKGEYYDIIPSDSDTPIVQEIAPANYPRQNFAFQDYMLGDVDRLWSIAQNQSGVREKSARTATELALIQQATNNRLSGEQADVVDFWLDLMETVSQLIQLYADTPDYIEILGADGAKTLEEWDKTTIRGEYLFDIVPDSAARPDAQHERDLALNLYNLVANDPFGNRQELLRDTVEKLGGDPDRHVKAPDPPVPEKPKISLSIKGDDLNPAMPQYQNVVNLLIAAGIPAEVAPPTGTETGGETGPAEVVDRERLRMAEADESDQRAGGLTALRTR